MLSEPESTELCILCLARLADSNSVMDPEDAAKITIPACVLASQEEGPDMVDSWAAKLKVENYTEQFADQKHGWMSARADLEDEKVKGEYERGYRIFLEFFAKYL